MNYKPAFILPNEDKPCTNAQVFATHSEAERSAANRFMSWTMPTGFCVVETEEPVNYVWDEQKGDVPCCRETQP